ncbi:MAG: MauE/DoxX family redox-associated membrane protein [Vicinamibacterales bacterium]
MELAVLGLRLLLAAVFLVAAIGKLRQRATFAPTLVAFGLPPRGAAVAADLIPRAELVVGALLLVPSTAVWAATASLVLLGLFTAAMALTLARGRAPACACFGAASAEPIGPATLVRNGALLLAAGLVVLAGPGSGLLEAPARWSAMPPPEQGLVALTWLLLAGLGATAVDAERQRATGARLRADVAALRRRLDARPSWDEATLGLPAGTPAPVFVLPRLEGDQASLADLIALGRPVLLVFSDAACSACNQLWPDIERWQRDHASALTIAVLAGGNPIVVEGKLFGFRVHNVLLRDDARLPEAYRLTMFPAAVIVGPDGRIDSTGAGGVPAIRALVEARTGG